MRFKLDLSCNVGMMLSIVHKVDLLIAFTLASVIV